MKTNLASSTRRNLRWVAATAFAFGSFAFASAYQEIANSAAEAKPLMLGDRAPDATLHGMDGKVVSLKDVLRRKRSVVIFYRGGWCPFCNAQLSDLVTVESELRHRGYQLIAISPDTPEELNKMRDKDHLTYRLFSDSSAEAMKKFGVAFRVDDGTFSLYRDKYHIDLERSSGQTHHILPVPSVFIVDRSGLIVFAHSNPDYKVRMKGADILAATAPR